MFAAGLKRLFPVLFRTYASRRHAVFIGHDRVLCAREFAGKAVTYMVDASDRLIAPHFILGRNYEVAATRYLCRTLAPAAHCIDVGANFGYFSVLMGLLCGKGAVIGIEPDAAVAALATDNLIINNLKDHCSILTAAANADGREMTLFRRDGRSGNTSITQCGTDFTNTMREAPEEPFRAAGLRIDDLLPRLQGRVDCLKIEVEGAEPLVFEGARETIAANPQIDIIMEWSPGQIQAAGLDVAAFIGTLRGLGLRPFLLRNSGRRSALSFEALQNRPYVANLLLRRQAG